MKSDTARAMPEVPSMDTTMDVLRARYSSLARSALQLSSDRRVQETPLRLRMQLSQQLGRTAFETLTRASQLADPSTLSGEIVQMLDGYEQNLKSVARELALWQRLTRYADEAQLLFIDLIQNGRGRLVEYHSLVQRILLDVRDNPGPRLQLGDAWLQGELTSDASAEPASLECFRGVQTARLMAWMAPQFATIARDAELLVLAGLSIDVGQLFWSYARNNAPVKPTVSATVAWNRHPLQGASLLAGIDEASCMLPSLVALHHERLDGTGFPLRSTKWAIPLLARVLQVGVRYLELRQEPITADVPRMTEDGALDCDCVAAARLLDEAERGRWDRTWATALLQSLHFVTPTRDREDTADRPELMLTEFGRRRLRFDAAHNGPAGRHVRSGSATPASPASDPSSIPPPRFLKRWSGAAASSEGNPGAPREPLKRPEKS